MKVMIELSTEWTFGDAFVRWLTDSEYSHAEFLLEDGRLLGARPQGGVRIRKRTKAPAKWIRLSRDAPAIVLKYAREQIGKKYDFGAFGARLICPWNRNWQNENRWFCSELIAWAFWMAGLPLLSPRVRYSRITPRDLLASPLLRLEAQSP